MEIFLNGSCYLLEKNCSIKTLIKNLDLSGKYAIEINQNIIPKSQYNIIKINTGDKIEIVQAIGGG